VAFDLARATPSEVERVRNVPKQQPAVVLVGRPNVGKSTLFNRIAGTRRASVSPMAGTTRDLIQQPAHWRNVAFLLADTAGMFGQREDPLQALVVEHGKRAFENADLFIFVVDGREGLVPADLEIATALRVAGRPVIVAINKTDDRRARAGAQDFYELGFDPVVEISAEHGLGTGDLLDEVIKRLPERPKVEQTEEPARDPGIVVVGRPNVGKSSLVNRILREERVLVSDVAGTTRDAVDATFQWHRRQFRIVDTAGIRKPGRVARGTEVEGVSVLLARRAIAAAEVVVLVIDATQGAADQDGAIAGEAERAGRSIVLAVNKWDLMKGEGERFSETFDEQLRYQLKFLDYAPIVHISALTGERTPRLLEVVDKLMQERTRRVPTPELNKFVKLITEQHPPPSPGRGAVRILYAAQVGVSPPTFALFTNIATELHFSYERFLVNQIRKKFGFLGTPIRLQIRRRDRKVAGGRSGQGAGRGTEKSRHASGGRRVNANSGGKSGRRQQKAQGKR
jgi:GTP-binding protein